MSTYPLKTTEGRWACVEWPAADFTPSSSSCVCWRCHSLASEEPGAQVYFRQVSSEPALVMGQQLLSVSCTDVLSEKGFSTSDEKSQLCVRGGHRNKSPGGSWCYRGCGLSARASSPLISLHWRESEGGGYCNSQHCKTKYHIIRKVS